MFADLQGVRVSKQSCTVRDPVFDTFPRCETGLARCQSLFGTLLDKDINSLLALSFKTLTVLTLVQVPWSLNHDTTADVSAGGLHDVVIAKLQGVFPRRFPRWRSQIARNPAGRRGFWAQKSQPEIANR